MDDEKNTLEELVREGMCSEETARTLSIKDERLQEQIKRIHERYKRDFSTTQGVITMSLEDAENSTRKRITFLETIMKEGEETKRQILEWLENPDVSILFYTTHYDTLYQEILIAKAKGRIKTHRRMYNPEAKEQKPYKHKKTLELTINEETFNYEKAIKQKVDELLEQIKDGLLRLQEEHCDEVQKETRERRTRNFWERYEEIKTIKIPERKYKAIIQLTRDTESYYLNRNINQELKEKDDMKIIQTQIEDELAITMQDSLAYRDYEEAEKTMNKWMQRLKEEIKGYEKIIEEKIEDARRAIMRGVQREPLKFTRVELEILNEKFAKQEKIKHAPTAEEIEKIIRIEGTRLDEYIISELSTLSWECHFLKTNNTPIPEDITKSRTLKYTIKLSDKDPITIAPIEKDTNILVQAQRKTPDPISETYTKIPAIISDNASHVLTITQETDAGEKRIIGTIIGHEATSQTRERIMLYEGIDANMAMIPIPHITPLIEYAEEALKEYQKRKKYDKTVMLIWNSDTSSIEGHSKKRRQYIDMKGVRIKARETIRLKIDENHEITGSEETEITGRPAIIEYYVI